VADAHLAGAAMVRFRVFGCPSGGCDLRRARLKGRRDVQRRMYLGVKTTEAGDGG